MATSPSTDNYTLGKGIVYFNQLDQETSAYKGERDLGNASAFTFSASFEKLEHYTSRGGLKTKDKEVISQITPSIAFTLDEVTKENLALLTLADLNEVTQTAGVIEEEAITAYTERRADLDYRYIGTIYTMPVTSVTGTFTIGETVTGATGEAILLAFTDTSSGGDGSAGTFTLIVKTAGFVAEETVTGGTSSATATATTAEVASSAKNALITDSTGSTVYVNGTDYEIDTDLKDDKVGRIHFLSGGTITDGASVKVTYAKDAGTYTEVQAFANTQCEGILRFVSDNPAGDQQILEIWRASLSPSGDTAMIGDDWSTLGFTGEVLKDSTHSESPYMNFIIE